LDGSFGERAWILGGKARSGKRRDATGTSSSIDDRCVGWPTGADVPSRSRSDSVVPGTSGNLIRSLGTSILGGVAGRVALNVPVRLGLGMGRRFALHSAGRLGATVGRGFRLDVHLARGVTHVRAGGLYRAAIGA
jgi:hypothetical protein